MMGASVCDLFPVPFLPASTGWLQGEGRAETGIEKLNLSWEPGRGCSSGRLVWKEAALVAARSSFPPLEMRSHHGGGAPGWNFPTAPPC